ncbi:MAG: hypothetical protein ACK4UJ_03760 [Leptonema sp. (in: bacteria)]
MKILLGFSFFVGLVLSAALFADSSIFFCEETSAYGAAWGAPMAKVKKVAKQYCIDNGGTNCQELLSCQTGYGAISIDNQGTIGASCGAGSQAEADQLSLDSCREYSNDPDACFVKHRWRG